MSIRPFASFVTLLAALLSTGGCAGAPHAVDVMSFNIRYANPGDGDNYWDHRRDLVFGVIERHAPDLIGLQEVIPRQLDELRAAFPDYRFLGQGREGGNAGEYSALMVRDERFAVEETGDFWLSPTPGVVASKGWDAALPRMCTWAVLRDRASGATLLAMNTHFDHAGSEARRASAGVILERRARYPELPVVVTGDLNAGEESAPLVALRAGGLRDTFRDSEPDTTRVGTFNGFKGESDGVKIDYILVDDGFMTVRGVILRDHEGERYPSDHYPVIAELAWANH